MNFKLHFTLEIFNGGNLDTQVKLHFHLEIFNGGNLDTQVKLHFPLEIFNGGNLDTQVNIADVNNFRARSFIRYKLSEKENMIWRMS